MYGRVYTFLIRNRRRVEEQVYVSQFHLAFRLYLWIAYKMQPKK